MRVFIGAGKITSVLCGNDDVKIPHSQIEVKDKDSVRSQLTKFHTGTVVINTASKINLEWCEENQTEAYAVNADGAVNVAEVCAELGHHLVHIGSGCIFDGMETERIYSEEDEPSPAAWYTVTKSEADKRILKLGYEKVTIVRPRQLISAMPNPTNMLTKFLTLNGGSFITSPNSLTCIEDMGVMLQKLIDKKLYGIYNVANTGHVSPHEIASCLKQKVKDDMVVDKISYSDYLRRLKVKRVNTLLSVEKYTRDTGHIPRSATAALQWCIENYGKNNT